MGLLDGQVIGTTKLIDHGPPAKRFNLVIVSEGFKSNELGSFATLTQQFIDFLFSSQPFDSLKCAFNIYRFDVSSTESGADNPSACGGDGTFVATRFDASFCNGGIQRLLCVNTLDVISVVEATVPEWHQILVIVNSTLYGGSGGNVVVTSIAGSWKKIALHEMGHSVFGLADEYPYWAGCAIDTNRNQYPGTEPMHPNITTCTDRNTLKWKELVLPVTPIPTTTNTDCTKCDAQPDPCASGTVGIYEGAYYYHCGVYRPEYQCMMKNLSGYCAVCRRQIIVILSVYLDNCYAPVFGPIPLFPAIFVVLILLIFVTILLLLSLFTEKVKCLVEKLLFIIRNCLKGNKNPCISI
ncbi:MAG: hypothetical protein IPJ16_10105 [Bacteroidales bacterium]|nr:hypothetical protein [Bacteroidales bacterium]